MVERLRFDPSQKIEHAGLELMGRSLPAELRGTLRGLIIRVIKSRKCLRAWLFKLKYPLPQLVLFESEPWWSRSPLKYPIRVVRGEALNKLLPLDECDAKTTRVSDSEMTRLNVVPIDVVYAVDG